MERPVAFSKGIKKRAVSPQKIHIKGKQDTTKKILMSASLNFKERVN